MFYTLSCIISILAGCASMGGLEVAQPQYSRAYTVGYEEAWQGITKTLEGLEIDLKEANKATGEIETKWFLRQSEKVMGLAWGGYWKERYKMRLTLVSRGDTTVVTIRSLVEEKRPGGTQAYRWKRRASSGEVEEFVFTEIGKVLAVKESK
ncbi:MAG TPA: hypothetical protein ACFYD5_07560 [Candidatus Tripitaka sp. YC43]